MDFFNAKYSEGKVFITSNTHWHTKIDGNFMLSKYSGEGDDVLDVIVDKDLSFANGNVQFSYGDDFCENYPSIYVGYQNPKYFKIVPNYICLNGKGSTATVTVFSNDNFKIPNISESYFSVLKYNENRLMIISNTDEEFGCDGSVSFTVNDIKNPNEAKVNVYQCNSSKTSDSCVFFANSKQLNDTIYSVDIVSIVNGEYANFTWDKLDGLAITKTGANTLIVSVDGIIDRKTTINFYNVCDECSITLYPKEDAYSVFDVAVKCNGSVSKDGGETELSILSQSINSAYEGSDLIEKNKSFNDKCK